jgi:hypothetical protein
MGNTRNSIHVPLTSPPPPLFSFLQNSFCMCFVGSLCAYHASPISKRDVDNFCQKFRPCRVPMPSQNEHFLNICYFGGKERNVSCFASNTVQMIRIQHYAFTTMNQILATSVKNYIKYYFTRFLILQGF